MGVVDPVFGDAHAEWEDPELGNVARQDGPQWRRGRHAERFGRQAGGGLNRGTPKAPKVHLDLRGRKNQSFNKDFDKEQ